MEKNPYIELAECLLPEEMVEYFGRMVINLCLGIYIAQAEDEEFGVVYAV